MRLRQCVTVGVAAALAGCGTVAATPLVLQGQPSRYLLGVDQMVSPDFSVDTAEHPVTAAEIGAAGGPASAQLTAAGFAGAASEEYFRSVGSLVVADGPVQVRDSVERFGSAAGAARIYGADIRRLDAGPGAVAVSTGSLGDEAHATTMTATGADGVTAIEITVEWRVANLLNVLVVRGRDGGTRPDDAFILAHRQTVGELGVATVAPATLAAPT